MGNAFNLNFASGSNLMKKKSSLIKCITHGNIVKSTINSTILIDKNGINFKKNGSSLAVHFMFDLGGF